MPQNSTPTFSHPKTICEEQKNREKQRGTEKFDETPARPNHTKSTSKPTLYATKVIPESCTHIRSRFRRILYVEHRRARETERRISELLQIRECEAFTNQIYTKNGVRGKKKLKNGGKRREKGCRNDVNKEREKDPTTRTEPNTLRSAQYPTAPVAQSLQPKTRKPSYGLTLQP